MTQPGIGDIVLLSDDPYLFEQIRLALSGTSWRLVRRKPPAHPDKIPSTLPADATCVIARLDLLPEIPIATSPVIAIAPAALVEFADPALFDDLIVEPYTPQELRFRLRRVAHASGCTLSGGRLVLRVGRLLAIGRTGETVEIGLTESETSVLRMLCRTCDEAVSREFLQPQMHAAASSRGPDMRISRLRKKLAEATRGWPKPVRIVSNRAGGYRLVE